jgi:hypothetical protein
MNGLSLLRNCYSWPHLPGFFALRFFATISLTLLLLRGSAQELGTEPFGRTCNFGAGPGYFGTVVLPAPYFTLNYEYEIAGHLTIAPFLGLASYRSGPHPYAGKNYYYRATIMPMGLKATYYLDRLVRLPCRWDLYVAASVGYLYSRKSWDLGYPGSVGTIAGATQTYLLAHLGLEYHLNRNTGLFADFSNGATVGGISFHRY